MTHAQDGIDPDSCEDVLIENSLVHAGDDCIAIVLPPCQQIGQLTYLTIRPANRAFRVASEKKNCKENRYDLFFDLVNFYVIYVTSTD